jgi:hypothetical protein
MMSTGATGIGYLTTSTDLVGDPTVAMPPSRGHPSLRGMPILGFHCISGIMGKGLDVGTSRGAAGAGDRTTAREAKPR